MTLVDLLDLDSEDEDDKSDVMDIDIKIVRSMASVLVLTTSLDTID